MNFLAFLFKLFFLMLLFRVIFGLIFRGFKYIIKRRQQQQDKNSDTNNRVIDVDYKEINNNHAN
jgi:hypothetical protein